MKKYLLLTGATGLVGQYLVRDLLLEGYRLALLVRAGKSESAQLRVESVLQMWESELAMVLPRPVVLEGDVSEPELGLSPASQDWIRQNCDRVLHNAAVLTFVGEDRAGEPWRTNLGGTQNVLSLCEKLGLVEMHYVSTAYVCGEREGVIREEELDCGQSFRNDYEHAKFLAEKLVREAKFLKRLTIYRPAVISGDSRTGYTSTYHGLYMYLQMIALVNRYTEPGPDGRRHTPVRMQMTGEEPRNIVPVDWVSQVICRLVGNPSAIGKTFHLAPKSRVTPRQIIDAGFQYFNSYGAEFVGPAEKSSDGGATSTERAIQESKTIYEAYESSDPEFDTSNVDLFLPDLPSPEIDSTMLARYWDFAEADRWGRRRKPAAQVEAWASELLSSITASELYQRLQSQMGEQALGDTVGLSICGVGGGEWKMVADANGRLHLESGLPHCHATCLELSMDQLASLLPAGQVSRSSRPAERVSLENAGSVLG